MKNIPKESLVFGLAFVLLIAKIFAGYPADIKIYLQIGFYCLIGLGLIFGALRQVESWRKYTLFACAALLFTSVLQLVFVPGFAYSIALLIGVIVNKRDQAID